MTITEMIKRVQRKHGLEEDGIAGIDTWTAIYESEIGDIPEPVEGAPVDERSETNITTLHPEVRPYARALIRKALDQGIVIKVISGTRTYEQQNALYEQGRSKPGPIVTKARGGHSNHNFGIAFDIGLFENGKYVPESSIYKVVGALGKEIGLEWGGDWTSIQDEPHFQLRPVWAKGMSESEMLATLRHRVDTGRDAYA